ncbi:MAG: serine/threonine-protein kinase HipA [Gammaproteobacteria bacterium]|nr:serine/threonine-protein kinase HipA [Gammaproteobacteria bacterium]
MARPSKSRALSVWMNGERVGTWATHPAKPDEFSYTPEWLTGEGARPISLSMPLRPTEYKGEAVTAYFDNLLPDSRRIRDRIQRHFGASSSGAFDLLAEIGRDCVGAIQLLPESGPRPNVRQIEVVTLTRKDIEHLLTNLLRTPPGGTDESEDFRISLAGAQEKTALLRLNEKWMRPKGTTPTTHILKLPIGTGGGGIDLTTSVENEWLCAEILREYGVPVARCSMDRFGEQQVLVVERFDRRMSSDGSWIVRLPQEDLCQATGVPSDRKYEADGGPGIRTIMGLLLGSSRADEDRKDFFKTQILYWLLCAIDGHGKNFSLFLEAGGSYKLTPRYDVLSAFPVLGTSKRMLSPKKVKMAMAAEGKNRHNLWHSILGRHWEETAKRCGLGSAFKSLVAELLDRTPAAVDSVSSRLPKGFPDSVASPILDGLRASASRFKL